MTGAEIMAAVSFFIGLLGFVAGIWWRVEGKYNKVTDDLSAHKLHVAETYITKQGMREATESIMEAISGVKTAVDHMTLRVDRIVENQAKSRTTRT